MTSKLGSSDLHFLSAEVINMPHTWFRKYSSIKYFKQIRQDRRKEEWKREGGRDDGRDI